MTLIPLIPQGINPVKAELEVSRGLDEFFPNLGQILTSNKDATTQTYETNMEG